MPLKLKQVKNNYQNQWLKDRRNAWLKENGPCKHCGSWENLEVDHIDPAQKVTHRVWSWREERRLVELAKCQVLCHDCHEKKTWDETRATRKHGTVNGYRLGCRCQNCLTANVTKLYQQRINGHKGRKPMTPQHAQELIDAYIKEHGEPKVTLFTAEEIERLRRK